MQRVLVVGVLSFLIAAAPACSDSGGGDAGGDDTASGATGDGSTPGDETGAGTPADDATGDTSAPAADASEQGFDSADAGPGQPDAQDWSGDPDDDAGPQDDDDAWIADPDATDATGEPDDVDDGPQIPEPDVVPSYSNCSEPGGDRNIYDLQDPQCLDHITPAPTGSPGVEVVLSGVLVSGVFSDMVFVQEAAGGPYSGISVFAADNYTGDVAPGDVIDVIGWYSEFYDSSQIYLEEWVLHGHGAPPEPWEPAHPSHISTQGPLSEMFEGVLVTVTDVETIHTKPDCPHEFGEFKVTGDLRIDDLGLLWDARLGDVFDRITGPLHYTFGNFKIEPRSEQDLDAIALGAETGISKCIEADCIEPESKLVSRDVIISEIMADPFGDDTVQEWIELHNTTDAPVSLDGWTIRDCAEQSFELIGASLKIPAGGYFVLGVKAEQAFNGGVPVDYAYGQAFYLPNTIGAVLLYDAADVLVDQTRYSKFTPWDSLEVGHSLERVSPDSDGTLPESWVTGEGAFGSANNLGTPGEPNGGW